MLPRHFFHIRYAPVYAPTLLSLAGTLFFLGGDRLHLLEILSDRWSLRYILATPFIHSGLAHFLLNAMALHYLGGMMLLPMLGAKRFIALLAAAALTGCIANNLLSAAPAIGMSAGVMGALSCGLYWYAKAPMRLLFIHDILRLPPFQYRHIAAFVVALDIAGITFNWNFFAHWAHLGGFATGITFGYIITRRPPF